MSSSSRDFSYFSLFTAGLACFVPFAAAYTQPTGNGPEGNPISQPGLNSVVPVGEPFSVTWKPTTQGTVTLVLLKGPSSNAVPQYAIAENIPNNGIYAWTPSTDLAPGQVGYGIQLIDDATGQYQYTTQFGIANPNYSGSSSSSAGSWGSSSWAAGWPSSSASVAVSTSGSSKVTISAILPTGTGYSGIPRNVTMVSPTGALTVPSTLATATTVASVSSAPASTPVVSSTPSSPAKSGAAGPLLSNLAGVLAAAALAALVL